MKNNKQAFANLLEENKGIIHKVALLYTRNQADKEDLYQDICLQLWKSFKSYREEAKFSTWLYRVALNTAISQVRKQKKTVIPAETYIQYFFSSTHDEQEEQFNLLFRAISQLNKIDRAIIFLWLDEKKYDEIADILGISKSNVSVKLVRIKQHLAEIIKELKNE